MAPISPNWTGPDDLWALRRQPRSQIGHLSRQGLCLCQVLEFFFGSPPHPYYISSFFFFNGAACGALGCRSACEILPITAFSTFIEISV